MAYQVALLLSKELPELRSSEKDELPRCGQDGDIADHIAADQLNLCEVQLEYCFDGRGT